MIFGGNPSERLLGCSDLRLNLGIRRLRPFRALPINNPPS